MCPFPCLHEWSSIVIISVCITMGIFNLFSVSELYLIVLNFFWNSSLKPTKKFSHFLANLYGNIIIYFQRFQDFICLGRFQSKYRIFFLSQWRLCTLLISSESNLHARPHMTAPRDFLHIAYIWNKSFRNFQHFPVTRMVFV